MGFIQEATWLRVTPIFSIWAVLLFLSRSVCDCFNLNYVLNIEFSFLTWFCLSFFICKMGIVPTSEGSCENCLLCAKGLEECLVCGKNTEHLLSLSVPFELHLWFYLFFFLLLSKLYLLASLHQTSYPSWFPVLVKEYQHSPSHLDLNLLFHIFCFHLMRQDLHLLLFSLHLCRYNCP